jgi:hypothetical protein
MSRHCRLHYSRKTNCKLDAHSLELIERFDDRWHWGSLARNKALSLPLLGPADIVEIMASHSTDRDSLTALPA